MLLFTPMIICNRFLIIERGKVLESEKNLSQSINQKILRIYGMIIIPSTFKAKSQNSHLKMINFNILP